MLQLSEIAEGLAFLHSQNIVHGDLRGVSACIKLHVNTAHNNLQANILVDEDWHACLADFGLAVFAPSTTASTGTTSSQHGGSVRWMAPEMDDPQSFGLDTFRRTFASDVFAFACVCIEVWRTLFFA